MASYLSNYLIDALANWTRGTAFPAVPANIYCAAFTTKPTSANTGGVEVSGGAYARVAVPTAAGSWAADSTVGANRQTDNAAAITFPQATANWGTVVGIGFYDASSGGNLLWYEDLTSSLIVNNGTTLTFPIGNIVDAFNNS